MFKMKYQLAKATCSNPVYFTQDRSSLLRQLHSLTEQHSIDLGLTIITAKSLLSKRDRSGPEGTPMEQLFAVGKFTVKPNVMAKTTAQSPTVLTEELLHLLSNQSQIVLLGLAFSD